MRNFRMRLDICEGEKIFEEKNGCQFFKSEEKWEYSDLRNFNSFT